LGIKKFFTLPASSIHHILNWKGTTKTVFTRLEISNDNDLQDNPFEKEVAQLFEKILSNAKPTLFKDRSIKSDDFSLCPYLPFISGIPDLVLYDSDCCPVLIVECKLIKSESEFKKIVGADSGGNVLVSGKHEYFT